MHAMKLKRKIALILRTGTLNLYTCMFKVYCKPIFIFVPQTFAKVARPSSSRIFLAVKQSSIVSIILFCDGPHLVRET